MRSRLLLILILAVVPGLADPMQVMFTNTGLPWNDGVGSWPDWDDETTRSGFRVKIA